MLIVFALPAQAQQREPVSGEQLRDIFSNTTLRATLGGGSEAIANYNEESRSRKR